jgi:preprotein translocase subunit SecG
VRRPFKGDGDANQGATMTHIWTDITSIIFAFTSIVLIFIILLQRGRGGGLAGAFGASGGQSAFGTKAGDVFTKITIAIAFVWVIMAAATGFAMRAENSGRFEAKATDANNPADGEVVPFTKGDKRANPKTGFDQPQVPADKAAKSTEKTSAPAKPVPATPPSKSAPAAGAGDAAKKPTPTK